MGTEDLYPDALDLSKIDFSHTGQIRELVRDRGRHMFGAQGDDEIDAFMDITEDLFSGRVDKFLAMDTAYHNINHTLQASLCLVELLHNRHFEEAAPGIGAHDLKRALIAVLFHDIGYLKERGDESGSGAKYTHLHEQRSCFFARSLLSDRGWPDDDISFVENLIASTGPTVDLSQIEYNSDIERLLGQTVCTADYIGQFSDPGYPDKLRVLFEEFRESYRYQQIPENDWPFASYEDLLRSTPDFWNLFVRKKMETECAGLWHYLRHPVSGDNPYRDSINRNLELITQRISRLPG